MNKEPILDQPRQLDGGMSCDQARRQIERLVQDNDLKEIERTLLFNHMRACTGCKTQLDTQRRLETRLKQAFAPLDTAPNFNQRLMALLPPLSQKDQRERKNTALPERSTRLLPQSGARNNLAAESGHPGFLLRGYRVAWAVASLVLIGLIVAVVRFGPGLGAGRGSESVPVVSSIDGKGTLIHKGANSMLADGAVLRASDIVISGPANLSLALSSGTVPWADVVLAPASEMKINNRHSYEMLKGKAYFHVHKDRPNKTAGEIFTVDAGGLASVHVIGTKFIVDVGRESSATPAAAIVVEEGRVEVHTDKNPPTQLQFGEELDVNANGSLASPHSVQVAAKLAWVFGRTAAIIPPASPPPVIPPPLAVQASAPQLHLNWSMPVKDVPLAGKTLIEGIDTLSAMLGQPPELVDFGRLAGEILPAVRERKLSFSIYREMPLRSALNWMARDTGLRIEFGAGIKTPHLRTAAPEEPLGPPEKGVIPDDVAAALNLPMEKDFRLQDLGLEQVSGLGSQSHVAIVFSREWWDTHARAQAEALAGETSQKLLDAVLEKSGAAAAWYDNVLYVSAPGRIEHLTRIERTSRPIDTLLQQPKNALILESIFKELKYPPLFAGRTDPELSETPALAHVNVESNGGRGACLHYTTGLLGAALAGKAIDLLESESPARGSAAELLSQPLPAGHVPDIQTLIDRVEKFVPVELRVKCGPFNTKAFVNKNLTMGQALEWAAWLSGCGLDKENNHLFVDTPGRCYGAPALQVLSLSLLAERRPETADVLPQSFARLLNKLYPAFFGADTELYCIGSRIVFTGDQRQLQMAQRLRASLARALEGMQNNQTFDPAAWRPEWRVQLDKNLSDPYQSAGDNLSGKFAGLLRQSELSSQLRCTVLVDPACMRDAGDKQIDNLETKGMSVGQVLERLVQKAGLNISINGEVIWIRAQ